MPNDRMEALLLMYLLAMEFEDFGFLSTQKGEWEVPSRSRLSVVDRSTTAALLSSQTWGNENPIGYQLQPQDLCVNISNNDMPEHLTTSILSSSQSKEFSLFIISSYLARLKNTHRYLRAFTDYRPPSQS